MNVYLKKQSEYLIRSKEANNIEEEIRNISLPDRKKTQKSRYLKKMDKLEKAEKKLKVIEKTYTNTYVTSSF